MKKYLIAFMLILTVGFAFGQKVDKSGNQYQKNVEDFNVLDLKLGSSFTDFNKLFPNAEKDYNHSNDSVGKELYLVSQVGNIPFVLFYFYDNKIYQIRLGYTPTSLISLGGTEVIFAKMNAKFGEASQVVPDSNNPKYGQAYWYFQGLNRYIYLDYSNSLLFIAFTDSLVEAKVNNALLKSQDAGF